MPELPEVEVLVRHLRPLLRGRKISGVTVRRNKVLQPTRPADFQAALTGTTIREVRRRGKYLLFDLRRGRGRFTLLGHLGMTGRMFVAPKSAPLPKHTAVVLSLGARLFVYEDTRYFGRLTLDLASADALGPEPWDESLTAETLAQALKKSRQPLKVKLLDQSLMAGIGNIYASEILFRTGLSPRRPANRVTVAEAGRLLADARAVLTEAIACGSTIPLNFTGRKSDGLFYFGRAAGTPDYYAERLCVYDRAGQPCGRCGSAIKRVVQAARSTFYCPRCQKK